MVNKPTSNNILRKTILYLKKIIFLKPKNIERDDMVPAGAPEPAMVGVEIPMNLMDEEGLGGSGVVQAVHLQPVGERGWEPAPGD